MKFNKQDYKTGKDSKTDKEGEVKTVGTKCRKVYMWNVPKEQRKMFLYNQVGEKEMDRMYGKTKFDLITYQRRPQITVPEPFNFADRPRKKKFRDFFLDDIAEEKRVEKKKIENYRFVANKVPSSTYGNRFQKMEEQEMERKELLERRSGLIRNGKGINKKSEL